MKTLKIIGLAIISIMLFSTSCGNTTANEAKNLSIDSTEIINVYYFHTNYRCNTCRTVQKVSEEAVKEMKDKNVIFGAYNIENADGKILAKKLDIHGQTLLITKGDKKIDITADGFLHAVSNPDKLKEIIREKVKSLK